MVLSWLRAKRRVKSHSLCEFPFPVESLCPVCLELIDGQLYEQDGQILMGKRCNKHGEFRELISTDAEFFKKIRRTHYEMPPGIDNPHCENESQCPNGCGLCEQHLSTPAMMNIDLTNRCNMNCPICFANSNTTGTLCEISLEQLDKMLADAMDIRPHRPSCLQLVGGEPTIHKDFIEVVRRAKSAGFTQVQIATNGILFAQDMEFTQATSQAGADEVYLQFDGLSDDVYRKIRGRPLVEIKLKAIENIGKTNMRIVLVPTIAKGLNDGQLGEITRFAVSNTDVISGISWQPVAITGRIDESKRREMRFTTADLARGLQEQCGFLDMYRDWYPFSVVMPFIRLMEITTGQAQMRTSCHPDCGCATYLIVDKQTNRATALPAFMDIEPAMEMLNKIVTRIENHPWTKKVSVLQAMNSLRQYFHEDRAPAGWGFDGFMEFVKSFVEFTTQHANKKVYMTSLKKKRFGTLLMASMHFQDVYNYQVDRSRHCIILYAAPNGRFYPFCTWNSGPCHRYAIEKEFSRVVPKIKEIRPPVMNKKQKQNMEVRR